MRGEPPPWSVGRHGSIRGSALGERRFVKGRWGQIVRDSDGGQIRRRRGDHDARFHRGEDRGMGGSRQRAQSPAAEVPSAAQSPDAQGAGGSVARAAGQARAPEGGDLDRWAGRVVRGQDPGDPTVRVGDARGGSKDGYRRRGRPRAVGGHLRHPERRGGRRVHARSAKLVRRRGAFEDAASGDGGGGEGTGASEGGAREAEARVRGGEEGGGRGGGHGTGQELSQRHGGGGAHAPRDAHVRQAGLEASRSGLEASRSRRGGFSG